MESRGNDWLTGFLHWAAEPCLEGEWIYRGQAAKYGQVLPSGLRDANRPMFRSGLYDVDYDLAIDIFQTSPVFKNSLPYPHIIDDAFGLQLQNMAYSMLGSPPSSDPRLSYPEVIRALAQHYGYATLFVDVSFNPIVAALFATNRWTEEGYVVREDGESVVFRWPAVRNSHSRLTIGAKGQDSEDVNVIDISRINPHMRRPYNQRAALATPIYDPKPLCQPFTSPISALDILDMAELPCCERFVIPAGGGHRINELEGISMTALFPDGIDLGYSYITVIALLSMLLPRASDEKYLPPSESMESLKQRALLVAHAILDRECLRNVTGVPMPEDLRQLTAEEARRILQRLSHTADAAITMIGSDEINALVMPALKRRLEDIQAEAGRRYATYLQAVGTVVGPERASAVEQLSEYTINMPSCQVWLREHFFIRLRKVESILDRVDFVPVYALERPDKFHKHIEALPSSDDYQKMVQEQLSAQRRWGESRFYQQKPT